MVPIRVAPLFALLCFNAAVAADVAATAASRPSEMIHFEEDVPCFRRGVDSWRVQYGAAGEWNDAGRFAVSVPDRHNFVMDYSRFPGMKPFPGAEEIVLAAEPDGNIGKATAELVLYASPGGERLQFTAPLAPETRFATKLDPSRQYQLGIVGVHRVDRDGRPWKIAFSSLRSAFVTPRAGALRVEAETGNPLHIVREGCGEAPVLRIRNAARERIAAHGALKAEGFRGEVIDLPVDVAPDGGQSADIPLPGGLAKGVWRITGELEADDGSVAKVNTRFAVMDLHVATPKQPRGTFRLGVLWHIQRFTPEDRRLCAAAMAACGAKLTRADMANMAAIQGKGPDTWDFRRTDELMETLEASGISLDAIIFTIPKWAASPENQTNSNWKAWAIGRPLPGLFERFCEGLARHYGTRIDYYEIGNEWDLQFRGTFEDAVEIQREAYGGLRRGCPEACVIPNGWTTAGESAHIARSGRPGLHEYMLRHAGGYFDVHPIHVHGPFAAYARTIREGFFPLREKTGTSAKPWFSNETAQTSVWGERGAAMAVWKKILWAWANGSVDYIWYNLKGTGWNPKDPEQGYGLVTADFRPRESYVAFAALATVVGGGTFRRAICDDGSRYCYEFAKGGDLVLTTWGEGGADAEVTLETDATRAWLVDPMGNRSALPLSAGKASTAVGPDPCAIVLEGATFAKTGPFAPREAGGQSQNAIEIGPQSGAPGGAPVFVLDRHEQVHDFFEGNPAEIARLWKGPEDNSAKVWLAAEKEGLRIRAEVRDDVHCQPFDGAGQFMGDDIQVALGWAGLPGQFEIGFARRDDGRPDVHCWIAPTGFDASKAIDLIKLATARDGDITRYDALLPYLPDAGATRETLLRGIRFNLMVNDNDGGGRDATIEIVPGTFHSKDISLAPAIRFPQPQTTSP